MIVLATILAKVQAIVRCLRGESRRSKDYIKVVWCKSVKTNLMGEKLADSKFQSL
jgi:hypothetical protein